MARRKAPERIELNTSIASAEWDYEVGQTVDVGGKTYRHGRVPKGVAKKWVKSGVASAVAAEDKES